MALKPQLRLVARGCLLALVGPLAAWKAPTLLSSSQHRNAWEAGPWAACRLQRQDTGNHMDGIDRMPG